jgi:hypothetical protein
MTDEAAMAGLPSVSSDADFLLTDESHLLLLLLIFLLRSPQPVEKKKLRNARHTTGILIRLPMLAGRKLGGFFNEEHESTSNACTEPLRELMRPSSPRPQQSTTALGSAPCCRTRNP